MCIAIPLSGLPLTTRRGAVSLCAAGLSAVGLLLGGLIIA